MAFFMVNSNEGVNRLGDTIANVVENNSENINKMIGMDVFGSVLGLILLTIITTVISVAFLYGIWWVIKNIVGEWCYEYKREKYFKKIQKLAEPLYHDKTLHENFKSSKYRKYQLKEYIMNTNDYGKNLDAIVDNVWKFYKE